MKPPILLLAPSHGLGGGIERYISAIESALLFRDVPCRRVNLLTNGPSAGPLDKIKFIRQVSKVLSNAPSPARVVAAHRDLLPVLVFVRHLAGFRDAVVFQYGSEVWSGRRSIGQRMVARPDIQVVAISSFTAGALVETTSAQVLAPGLNQRWFDTLCSAVPTRRSGLRLLTTFRLGQWRSKGVETLLAAMSRIDHPDLHLTVCGSGPVPEELVAMIEHRPDCSLVANMCDEDLARQYASADIFVLATRTAPNSGASGEGFGLVLVEAQIAGTPVIAPAFGGSADALQAGLTGLVPRDESVGALVQQLTRLVGDADLRTRMSFAATKWARAAFDPVAYADRVVEVIGCGGADDDGQRSQVS